MTALRCVNLTLPAIDSILSHKCVPCTASTRNVTESTQSYKNSCPNVTGTELIYSGQAGESRYSLLGEQIVCACQKTQSTCYRLYQALKVKVLCMEQLEYVRPIDKDIII